MSYTTQMERDSYKKMYLSLKAYSRAGGLLKMTTAELEHMPKEVMIACAPSEIALVWEKLPEKLKTDIDVLKYQYCTDHYQDIESEDVGDGPAVRRLFCCYCQVNDVNITTENCIKTSKGFRRFLSFNCLNCCKLQ